MTFREIRKKAIELGVDVEWAVDRRIRCLANSIAFMVQSAREVEGVDVVMCSYFVKKDMEELCRLKKESWLWNTHCYEEGGVSITMSMISKAKEYPIEKLVEFDSKGYISCPRHKDIIPSLHHDKKHNKAYCFSCGETWDSIDWYEEFWEVSFVEAVRKLCGGEYIK